MEKSIVQQFYKLFVIFSLLTLLGMKLRAETYHLTDGQTVTGEVVAMDEKGIVLKGADGNYGDHTPWSKLSQADLRELQQNPKAAAFVEPFIELTQADRQQRTEIVVKEVPHEQRPARRSILIGMTTSGIGLFVLLVLVRGQSLRGL